MRIQNQIFAFIPRPPLWPNSSKSYSHRNCDQLKSLLPSCGWPKAKCKASALDTANGPNRVMKPWQVIMIMREFQLFKETNRFFIRSREHGRLSVHI